MFLYALGKHVCRVLCTVFGRLRVMGRAQVPRTGGLLVVSNHTSYADPPLLGVALPRPIRFMAKVELFTHPLFGWLITSLGAFPVRRGTADRQAIRQATELLQAGNALTIFMEGGTSPDGKLQSPDLGAAMIAMRAGVPILPVAIIDADKMLPRHGGGIHFARVQVIIGTPLSFPAYAGHADRTALQAISRTVMRTIAEMMRAHGAADRVPEGYLETLAGKE